jgi:hypothetical protein
MKFQNVILFTKNLSDDELQNIAIRYDIDMIGGNNKFHTSHHKPIKS